MVPVAETAGAKVSQAAGTGCERERQSRTFARLLQAQKAIQVVTIISLGELGCRDCYPGGLRRFGHNDHAVAVRADVGLVL